MSKLLDNNNEYAFYDSAWVIKCVYVSTMRFRQHVSTLVVPCSMRGHGTQIFHYLITSGEVFLSAVIQQIIVRPKHFSSEAAFHCCARDQL